MSAQPPTLHKGIVKQALSGDTVVIRGQPRNGPPPERTLCLSNVTAPRLARRPNPNLPQEQEQKDEPYAWEAREFLRKKVVGKEVYFTIEYKTPGGREYGFIYLGKDPAVSENITETLVAEGLVELRRMGLKAQDEKQQLLIGLEDSAKAGGKGKWGPKEETDKHIRNITWAHDNLSHFVDSFHKKPVDAVIEHVRDGCTVRAFLLPSMDYVTVMLSGIKCPMFKIESDGKQVAEPFAAEAKFFTEVRLLQRDVKIVLESVSNQNCIGSVLHPNGNIAELLVREGFGRLADWSMGVVSTGPELLREAEKIAKSKKVRMWKDYEPNKAGVEIKDKNFTAKVIEILNGDGMHVKLPDGNVRKIFLSSVRPPRPKPQDPNEPPVKRDPKNRPRPLYDTPYMYEAREFLRKKLIDKKVNVSIDYIQPKTDDYPEKTCCTVTVGGINIAEALIGRGLGTAVRYRQDDDQRSSAYYELLAAEERAKKKEVGIFSKKDAPTPRVSDTSGDVTKSKQFLPFLQRAGRTSAIVEFVASGSRLRLYIPKETCLVTFLLSGIECPRGTRMDPSRPGTTMQGDPFGDAAAIFTKERVLQRDVEVQVESMDKGGNFIGWLFLDSLNLSVALVEEGLSKVHFTAEKSNFYQTLLSAEERAKQKKANIWSLESNAPKEVATAEVEPQERKVSYKTVILTEVCDDLSFYAQNVDTGPQLEKLMEQLRSDMSSSPPLPGSYTPRKGDLCAAKFTDGEWYRARIEKIEAGKMNVLYIDFGNRESVDIMKLATLPGSYHSLPPQAKQYHFACIALPTDEEDKQNAVDIMYNDNINKQCLLNVEYKKDGSDYVTLLFGDQKEDIALGMLSDGLLLAESRKERRLQKLVEEYTKAQDKAKAARLNLWQYGDFTEDDAREFGF